MAALLALSPGLAVARCPERAAWPVPDWPVASPAEVDARAEPLAALAGYLFPSGPAQASQVRLRTDGALLAVRGQVVWERYANGYGPTAPHATWSIAKVLTSALAGAAVARGALALDDSICLYRPGPPHHCAVTLHHLLESASGFDWTETYEGSALQTSSVLAMLYGEGHDDMAGFVLGQGQRDPPGARWAYSSGDSVLLAAVLGGALTPSLGRGWPEATLLEPLGMTSAVLERDAVGTPVGSSWLHATARDLARLGLLYIADGCWRGARVLQEGWVAASTSVSLPLRAGSPSREPGDVQGWGWWLNRPVPELGQGVPWAGVPQDAFWARGHWGQLLLVVPSLELVAVRFGDDRETGGFDAAHFAALAVAVAARREP